MKLSMFHTLLRKSLVQRRGRSAVTLAALLLGACLVGALLSISMDVGQKAGRQLESYGPNMLLLPKGGLQVAQGDGTGYLMEGDLSWLESLQREGTVYYAPYLYALAEASSQKVVLGGTRLEAGSPLASWWKVDGSWPDAGPSSALVGVAAARVLGVKPGDSLTLRYGTSSLHLQVAGVLETGGSEDSQVIASLQAVQGLLGRNGAVGLVQVRAPSGVSLEALARQFEQEVPGSEARIVGQVDRAEQQVLGKVELLLAIVALLVLLASSLSVSSTLTAAVLERTREIGLMKALGARDGTVVMQLVAEVLFLGISGGILGCGLGFVLAQVIGLSVFGSAVSPQPAALGLTLGLAVVVALVCCIVPVRRVLAVDPAITLKGE
ncbi:MAG: ABC transporter permease [Dehalococcoidia bacterium]|nr:ABC transporter permease [Dehalococcoidia bacterium]